METIDGFDGVKLIVQVEHGTDVILSIEGPGYRERRPMWTMHLGDLKRVLLHAEQEKKLYENLHHCRIDDYGRSLYGERWKVIPDGRETWITKEGKVSKVKHVRNLDNGACLSMRAYYTLYPTEKGMEE